MNFSRREFLKLSGVTASGLLLPGGAALAATPRFPLHKPVGETPTICCFCGVGCGAIVASGPDGKVVNIEGDPDHPINRGTLCSKGSALAQLNMDPGNQRLKTPLYRGAGKLDWEPVSWDWAIEQIARRIKDLRDEHFEEKDKDGQIINRLTALASLGGAAHDNEECSLIVKAMRALGLVFVEHQARI